MATANTIQVTIGWDIFGEEGFNVLHYLLAPGADPIDTSAADAIGDAVTAAFTDTGGYALTCTEELSAISLTVRDLRTDDLAPISAPGFGFSGTGSSEETFSQLAMVVTLRTAFSGRSGRGRIYLPPPGVSNMSNGAFTNAAAATTTAERLIELGENPGEVFLGVFSRELNVTRPVTSVVVRSAIPGGQRRRSQRP